MQRIGVIAQVVELLVGEQWEAFGVEVLVVRVLFDWLSARADHGQGRAAKAFSVQQRLQYLSFLDIILLGKGFIERCADCTADKRNCR